MLSEVWFVAPGCSETLALWVCPRETGLGSFAAIGGAVHIVVQRL